MTRITIKNTLTTAAVLGFLAVSILALPRDVFAWNLEGSCTGVPSTVGLGQTITWTATQTSTIQPGEGHYEWSWSGDEGLSGSSQSVTKSYALLGTRVATVKIKLVLNGGGSETITRSCSVNVVTPACPIPAAPGRIIVNFPTVLLVSYPIAGYPTQTSPVSANIPAGSYKVTLSSYDSHPDRYMDGVQAHEQWFARLSDNAGTIASSGVIDDIADLIPFASRTQEVNGTANPLVLTRPATKLTGIHAFISYSELTPNSVHPSCVAFDPIPVSVPLTGSCTASPSSVLIGSPVTYTTSASGGTGTFAYSWTGTDSLSGTSQSVTKSYSTTGTKTATVTITSGAQSVTAQCQSTVTTPPPPEFKLVLSDISCEIGSNIRVHFIVNQLPTGVSNYGSVTYVLNGITRTASLVSASGSTAHYAEVISGLTGPYTVSSGFVVIDGVRANLENPQTVTLSCPVPPTLSISCTTTPSSATTGTPVTYSSTVSGGTGTYSYSWTGTDGLSGTNASVTKTYSTTGTKTATVTVTSGTQTKTAQCQAVITMSPSTSCPIPAASGRIIVDIPNQLIVSYPIAGYLTQTSPVVTSIPAGSYKVTLSSYDYDPDRIDDGIQAHEQWFAKFSDASGLIASSGVIDDIADLIPFASRTEEVNGLSNPLVLARTATKVVGAHAFASASEPTPNSVYPNCVALDPIPPSGECELQITKSVDKTTASIGDTLTYTLNVKNVGTADCTGGGVKIKDVVDSHLEYLSETHTSNLTAGYGSTPLYTSSTRTLIWNGNTLTPGESGTITWKGKITTPLACGSFTVPNKASITSYEYDNFSTWVHSNTVTTNVSNICIPPLVGSCSASPASVLVGNPVTYTASSTGGTGTYAYSWTGTDGLTGNTQSLDKSYSSSGTKTATVTITSGLQSVTAQCSATVTTPPPSPATLKVIKTVINNNGGTKTAADFDIFVKQGSAHVTGSPANGSATGVTFTLPAGSYSVGENDPSSLGYTMTGISGHCASNGSVTLAAGESKTCTITNDDIPPPVLLGSCSASPASVLVGNPVTYTASSTGGIGSYTYSWSGDDSLTGTLISVSKSYSTAGTKNAQVIITSGTQSVTAACEAVVTTPPPSPATLKVIKLVINDNGGSKTPADFDIFVKQGTTHVTGSPATGSATGTTFSLPAGSYTVGEDDPGLLGYTMEGITGDCSSAGAITLSAGESKTCTITNNDNPPPPVFTASCSSSPSSISVNQTTTFTATSTGGTGTYAYSWTGTDGLTGNTQSVDKSYATTGTKSAQVTVTSGLFTQTAECTVAVTAPPGPTPFTASCSVSPSSIRTNESVTWSASASGGTGTYSFTWTGTESLSETSQTATKTYTSAGTKNALVTVTSGSEVVSASCSINVFPPPGCGGDCGGGGFDPPTVVLLKKPPEGRVLSAIYLSQIPYTGIGDWYKIPLFIIILGIWSASIVYFIRSKIWQKRGGGNLSQPAFVPAGERVHENVYEIRGEEMSVTDWTPETINYDNQETMHANEKSSTTNGSAAAGVVDVIAAEAQRNRTVISEEGMQYIAEKSGYRASEALSLVDHVVKNAENMYSRDEGWLLLNKEKVITALTQRLAPSAPAHVTQASRPVQSNPSPEKIPSVQQTTHAHNAVPAGMPHVDSALFVSWLSTGDKARVSSYLKNLRERPGAADAFLKNVVLDLDVVYRSRFEEIEEVFDERLAHTVSGLSNTALENLISALLSMFDQNYQSASLGVKLALIRASEVGKGK